jgi:hypothetical protein
VALDRARAGGRVVALEGVDDVGEGEAVTDEFHGVGPDVVLLHVAADRIDAGDPGDALELGRDDPLLHGAEVRGPLHVRREALALAGEERAVGLPAGRRVVSLERWRGERDGVHVHLAQAG